MEEWTGGNDRDRVKFNYRWCTTVLKIENCIPRWVWKFDGKVLTVGITFLVIPESLQGSWEEVLFIYLFLSLPFF